jgi:hypothetical protein
VDSSFVQTVATGASVYSGTSDVAAQIADLDFKSKLLKLVMSIVYGTGLATIDPSILGQANDALGAMNNLSALYNASREAALGADYSDFSGIRDASKAAAALYAAAFQKALADAQAAIDTGRADTMLGSNITRQLNETLEVIKEITPLLQNATLAFTRDAVGAQQAVANLLGNMRRSLDFGDLGGGLDAFKFVGKALLYAGEKGLEGIDGLGNWIDKRINNTLGALSAFLSGGLILGLVLWNILLSIAVVLLWRKQNNGGYAIMKGTSV